jgi:serine phosphatase RsbU (regulator of sigma subunit)
MSEQKTILEEDLARHQGNQKQRDDITLIGIRL